MRFYLYLARRPIERIIAKELNIIRHKYFESLDQRLNGALRRCGEVAGSDQKMKKQKLAIGLIIVCVMGFGIYLAHKIVLLKPKIAVIPIKGEIGTSVLGQATSPESIISNLEKAEKDPTVKGIILEINSPGGSIVAIKQVESKIKEIEKPIVAWLEDTAASGAYWIASAADKIVADPFTMTGSIGVSASYLEFSGLLEKFGIKYVRLVKGERKDIGSPYRNLTEEERKLLERYLDLAHQAFIQKIAENRNLTQDQVSKLATGEPILGIDAKEYGLVDELGGEKEAVEMVSKLANITKPETIYYKEELGLLSLLERFLTIAPSQLVLSAART